MSAAKENAKDGDLDTSAIIVFEKAPPFMVENSNIKIREGFPAIRWRFGCKATCAISSIAGHYKSQCLYTEGNIPECLVKKVTQATKSKLASKKSTKKTPTKSFEDSKTTEKALFEVTEEYQAAKKQQRKQQVPQEAINQEKNIKVTENFWNKLDDVNNNKKEETKKDNVVEQNTSIKDVKPSETSNDESNKEKETTKEDISKNTKKTSPQPLNEEQNTEKGKKKESVKPKINKTSSAEPKPANKSVKERPGTPTRNSATKATKDTPNKLNMKNQTAKAEDNVVDALSAKKRTSSNPAPVSPLLESSPLLRQ